MTFITGVLMILLIPFAVLAGKRVIGKDSTSALRSVFTVVQSTLVLTVILAVFEMGYSTIYYYSLLPNGYSDISIEFLRYAQTALVSLYLIVAVATELISRNKDRLKLGIAFPVAIGILLLLLAGLSVLIYVNNNYYFDYCIYAIIGLGIACILHITNLLLSFKSKWQRKVITAVNGAVFAIMAVIDVIVIRMGTSQMTDEVGTGIILGIGLAAALFIAPSAICLGTVVSEQLKANQ